MNDKPPTDKLDRDKLHASSVWEPSNREPSRRLVLRLATNALSNRKPSAKHLLFRQVFFWRSDGSQHPCIFSSILPNFV